MDGKATCIGLQGHLDSLKGLVLTICGLGSEHHCRTRVQRTGAEMKAAEYVGGAPLSERAGHPMLRPLVNCMTQSHRAWTWQRPDFCAGGPDLRFELHLPFERFRGQKSFSPQSCLTQDFFPQPQLQNSCHA